MGSKESQPLNLKFYATTPHQCSYLKEQTATTAFLDPNVIPDNYIYTNLSQLGFRRSGQHVYKPHCDHCNACVPIRLPIDEFVLSKSQRRVWKQNQDLKISCKPGFFSKQYYQLYEDYINHRHQDGDMYPASKNQYRQFLLCNWANTLFFEFYDKDKLVCVAVVDTLNDGLSAVYTFFCPLEEKRSLGRFAILTLIEQGKKRGSKYLYLGYLIKGCKKMNYKSQYRPLECLIENRWIKLT